MDDVTVANILQHGEVEVLGRMPWSSNATYLGEVTLRRRRASVPSTSPAGASARCGTSRRGSTTERWRPTSCRRRSAGTWCRSRSCATDRSGWDRCSASSMPTSNSTTSRSTRTRPTTPSCGPCARSTSWATTPTARAVTACSALDGRIQGIDHGLMFHHEFKLRTVIWEFGGEPVPDDLLAAVDRAGGGRPAGAPRRACSTPSSGTPCEPGLGPWCGRATSRSTRPADATPGRWSDARWRSRRPTPCAGPPGRRG